MYKHPAAPTVISHSNFITSPDSVGDSHITSDRYTRATSDQLWMAIHMPLLPILASMGTMTHAATVVFQKLRGQYRIISANKSAKKHGISLNMDLTTAQTLSPQINILSRDIHTEKLIMEQFANKATSWSPNVAIQNNHIVLLEIGNCLRLNGGLSALIRMINKSLPHNNLDCHIAVTPTSASAVLCAKSNYDICVTHKSKILSYIGEISIEKMSITKQQKSLLKQIGIDRINDLLRLPRTGLARRMGQHFVKELDRLIGKQVDPQLFYNSSPYFLNSVDFENEIYSIEKLLIEGKALLDQLEQFLRESCSAIDCLEWRVWGDNHSCTHIPIRLSRPQQRVMSAIGLSRLAFESSLPSSGITRFALYATPLPTPYSENFSVLYGEESYERTQLLDRLYIRLGYHAVRGICCQLDHKPEKAWKACKPGITTPVPLSTKRPLWLFDSPKPLSMKNGQPVFYGPLELSRHERIVANWWNKDSIQRDYYQAKSLRGLIWVFRDLWTKSWHIHGMF